MKSEKEVESLAVDYAGRAINSRPKIAWVLQDVRDAYKEAYLQAQKDMIEEARGEFEDFCANDVLEGKELAEFRIMKEVDRLKFGMSKAFLAGRLSGLKQLKQGEGE
jgi:hypothetical protein